MNDFASTKIDECCYNVARICALIDERARRPRIQIVRRFAENIGNEARFGIATTGVPAQCHQQGSANGKQEASTEIDGATDGILIGLLFCRDSLAVIGSLPGRCSRFGDWWELESNIELAARFQIFAVPGPENAIGFAPIWLPNGFHRIHSFRKNHGYRGAIHATTCDIGWHGNPPQLLIGRIFIRIIAESADHIVFDNNHAGFRATCGLEVVHDLDTIAVLIDRESAFVARVSRGFFIWSGRIGFSAGHTYLDVLHSFHAVRGNLAIAEPEAATEGHHLGLLHMEGAILIHRDIGVVFLPVSTPAGLRIHPGYDTRKNKCRQNEHEDECDTGPARGIEFSVHGRSLQSKNSHVPILTSQSI